MGRAADGVGGQGSEERQRPHRRRRSRRISRPSPISGVISKFGIPEKILFVEKLARTSVGKINKKELREKYGAV